jgi:hypothetical protein
LPKISLDPIKALRNDHPNYQEQRGLEDNGSAAHSVPPSPKKSDIIPMTDKKNRRRSKSEAAMTQTVHPLYDSTKSDGEPERAVKRPHTRNLTNINTSMRKRRHATSCDCLKNGQHYDNVALDATFSGSVEKIYNLLFTSGFVKQFMMEHEKCTGM